MGLPVVFHLGLAIVGAERELQITSINPRSNSQSLRTPTLPLKPWMDGPIFYWMDGESTQPSNIKHWMTTKTWWTTVCLAIGIFLPRYS
jgi:hypothetical protein